MQKTSNAPAPLDDTLLAEMEVRAIEMARGAGRILSQHFGSPLDVEFKGDKKRDVVTAVDKECQEFLASSVSRHYPDHGFLGEEESEQRERVAPDFVWVADPLDGTKNFLAGLPVFACSIGVLYRGAPLIGALYVPWPGEEGGVVMHARKGGGAFVERERITVFDGVEPEAYRLVALPASFRATFRLSKPLRANLGEVRVSGSIAYEMAMIAKGVLQYSVTIAPRLWDVAAGAALVMEAGGVAMVKRRRIKPLNLPPAKIYWGPLESFIPSWRSGTTTLDDLRRWSEPLVLGSPPIAAYVAHNVKSRLRLTPRLYRKP